MVAGAKISHKSLRLPLGAPADGVDVEAMVSENLRLRRRVEELQELVDSRAYDFLAPPPDAAVGVGGRGARRRDRGRGGKDNPAAEAACDAILWGQVEQLRRQVRLQHCAVDASAAVTREVGTDYLEAFRLL